MNQQIKTKDMVLTALLIAIGIIIPIYFGFLRVILPPAFTATIMAHVPIFIAMFISPWSAFFTALGTTVGFGFSGLAPVVVVRAASHVIFALIGAYMIKRRQNLLFVGIITALLHAVFEALVVYLFFIFGLTTPNTGESILHTAFYVTGIGTLLHDIIDYVIACILGFALVKAKMLAPLPAIWKKA